MALKHGQKKIQLNKLSNSVPYREAKSMFSTVVDNFSTTLERMEQESLAAAQAKYFQKFDMETRDWFIKTNEEFKFDPKGMADAVDNYSKTILDSVPAAYKIQANAKLNGWSTNSILSAASNKDSCASSMGLPSFLLLNSRSSLTESKW